MVCEIKQTIFVETGIETLLGKIVGVYKIGFKNAATGAGLKMDVLIIENLFYEKKVDRSYDLKVKRKHCIILCKQLPLFFVCKFVDFTRRSLVM
jgi:hypothetical protein